jgi:monoamine oxidase
MVPTVSSRTTASRKHVCVVGAGFAGLAAADALMQAGARVTVLEARDRVGGRVASRTLPDGAVVELGAEFILPGYDVMHALLERARLGLWDKGMYYGDRDARGIDVSGVDLGSAYRRLGGAVHAVEDAREAISVAGLLARLDLPPAAREAIRARTEISCAADAALVDATVLAHLAAADRTPCPSVAGGNGRLAEFLAAGLGGSLLLREPVSAVAWRDEGVTVRAATLDVEADALVVAVPAPCLGEIGFDPVLPEALRAEAAAIVTGHAAKLFVPLRERPRPSAVMSVPERYWTWTAAAEGGVVQPVASAFAGSERALEGLAVAGGPERWAGSLRALRPDLALETGSAVLSTWSDDRWSRGAYSVQAPGGTTVAALVAGAGPIAFAGEHTAGEWSALMEGALRSGLRAAEQVLARLRAQR